MKKITYSCIVLLFSILAFSQNLIIKDVNIISMTSDKVDAKQSLLIENGIITEIGKFKKLKKKAKTAQVINGTKKYVMPGLADMHMHFPAKEKWEQMFAMNLAAGVTEVRVMDAPINEAAIKNSIDPSSQWTHPNFHYSAIIRPDKETHDEAYYEQFMKEAKQNGLDFVKVFGVNSEADFDYIMKYAKLNDLMVCGHFPAYPKGEDMVNLNMEKVLKSGFKSIEHLGGYSELENPSDLKNAMTLTKANGVYNCPTMDYFNMALFISYPDGLKDRWSYNYVSKETQKQWDDFVKEVENQVGGSENLKKYAAQYKSLYTTNQKNLKELNDNGCLLLMGSDPGNEFQPYGFNIYDEMKEWSLGGIDNYTILKAATVNAATFFNQESQWGTVEIGKKANLILLDKNPLEDIHNITTVETTILNGKAYPTSLFDYSIKEFD